MIAKLQTALTQIKTNIVNTWNAIQPVATIIENVIAYVLNLIAKLSNQLSLIIGIAIGYKLEPIIRVFGPLIKIVLDIAFLPLKILGLL
jgi:hypothetical protein